MGQPSRMEPTFARTLDKSSIHSQFTSPRLLTATHPSDAATHIPRSFLFAFGSHLERSTHLSSCIRTIRAAGS